MAEASHACRILAAEMIHFVNQIQYFLLFEVLESAWVELTSTLEQVMSFDQILVAHDNFLRLIMQRMFLMPESQVRGRNKQYVHWTSSRRAYISSLPPL